MYSILIDYLEIRQKSEAVPQRNCDILRSCGHVETIGIIRSSYDEIERYAVWLSGKPCKSCSRVAERENADARAAKAAGADLPVLVESDKQVGAAIKIRANAFRTLTIGAGTYSNPPPRGSEAIQRLAAITDASWWISNPVPTQQEKLVLFIDKVLAGAFDEIGATRKSHRRR